MAKDSDKADKYKTLRAKAEKALRKKIAVLHKESKGDFKKVLHELQVHQIELEMQNEELRRTQKDLEDSRSKYADLYDFAPVGYFTFDRNGLVIEANLAGCGMLGVPRVNLLKKPFHNFVEKGSHDAFYLHRQHVSKTESRQTCEITIVRKDKSRFEALLESIPAEDANGKVYYCRTAITDITKRKKAEEEIKMLAKFPSENPSPILRISAEGKILYSNKPGMVVMQSWNRIIGQKSPDKWNKLVKDALGSKKILVEEMDIQGRAYAFVFTPIAEHRETSLTEGGYVNVYGMDITDRKQLEQLKEAIKEQAINERNRLEAVMEALPVGVALLDAKGARIEENEAFEKVWGSPLPEANSVKDYAQYKAWWADTGKLVKPREWACIQAVLKGKTVTGQLLEIQRFDGPRAFVINGASPVRDANDKIIGSAVAIQDITKQHKAEEAMRESETKYRNLFERMTEGFALHEIICDKKGNPCDYRFIEVNPAFEKLAGLKQKEIMGRTVKEVIPGIEEFWIKTYGKVALTGKSTHFEHYSKTLGRNYEVFAYCPKPMHFAVVFVDITERTRVEEELRESRENLIQAQIVGNIGSWRLDIRKDELTWSDENHRIFGIAKGTPLTYETFLSVVHPDDREYADTRWKAALAGEPYDIEHRLVVDSKIKWVREKAYLEFDDKGTLSGGFGITQDITDRKLAESNQALTADILRLLNREDDLHSTIGEILHLIRESTGFDAVGLRMRQGDDCPYYEQNGFTEDFLREENFLCAKGGDGAIIRNAEGKVTLECTCGLVLSRRTDPSMPCFTKGGSFWTNKSTDLLALTPETDPRTNPRNRCIHIGFQSVGLFPVRSGNEIIGLLQLNGRPEDRFTSQSIRFFEGLADNIGLALKRKQAEEELKKLNEELNRSNREFDEFSHTASHDLRAPLRAVSGFAGLLNERYKDKLDDKAREYIKFMIDGSKTMDELITGLLGCARVQTRGENPKLLPAGMALRLATENLKNIIAARGAVITSDELPEINADGNQFTQLLQNLIDNAIKFRSEEKPEIHVGCQKIEGGWQFSVRDNGIGIDKQYHERIFKIFQRLHTQDKYPGYGVGLTIAKKIVERHGGKIWVDSEQGKGATFYFTMPE